MLVLSRRLGERVWIGDGVVISILETHKGSVRLGIEAPRDIRVDRDEVRQRRNAEEQRLPTRRLAQLLPR